LVSFALAGCGGGGPKTALVRGTVTYKGKPVPNGTVTFIPASGHHATGDIRPDGSYTLTRSEERRVGKECRSRWAPDQKKRKNADIALVADPKFFSCFVRFESSSIPTTIPSVFDVYLLDVRHDGCYYTVNDCVTIDVHPRTP